MSPVYINDTIAALATPAGKGGVGIIRISGGDVQHIAQKMLSIPSLTPRHATHCAFYDQQGEVIDEGIALLFTAPHSFTGEDVLELQGHGGAIVMDTLLKAVLSLGARMARPGEFSERAFHNNKMDLAQAEAIADLIDASTQAAARSAVRSLQGDFSKAIEQLRTDIIQIRVFVEAAIDFSDEEIDFLSQTQITEQVQALQSKLQALLKASQQGQLLRDGVQVVIAGAPNSGKSSLLNYLSGEEVAIVTPIPGTTRDILHSQINIDGLPLHLIDTAGLRQTDDTVEKLGIERAKSAIKQADIMVYMVDESHPESSPTSNQALKLPDQNIPTIIVHNKIDLTQHTAHIKDNHSYLSLKTGKGIDQLLTLLKETVGYHDPAENNNSFIARRRHLDALHRAKRSLENGLVAFTTHQEPALFAEDLRQAHQALSEITGAYVADDLLGEIFSSFCVGK